LTFCCKKRSRFFPQKRNHFLKSWTEEVVPDFYEIQQNFTGTTNKFKILCMYICRNAHRNPPVPQQHKP
jgi:hypothetical protein